jgi:PadR family transcriptional regulator, regulatory protein PadR
MAKSGHWLHGFLDLCLLALLRSGPDYGFGLAQRLGAAGLGDVPGGTLYPALLRLERQGWVQVSWADSDAGPRRKYYALTEEGLRALGRDAAAWQRFRDGIDGLIASGGPEPGPAGDVADTTGGGRGRGSATTSAGSTEGTSGRGTR